MKVIVTGGARHINCGDHFDIGKRNFLACRKILFRNNVIITQEDVDGTSFRTLVLEIERQNIHKRLKKYC